VRILLATLGQVIGRGDIYERRYSEERETWREERSPEER
jgi:hypothetical protein